MATEASASNTGSFTRFTIPRWLSKAFAAFTAILIGVTAGSASSAEVDIINPVGEQRSLVLLVNFLDNADQMPFSVSQAQGAVFGDVSSFFEEASYGRTWLNGDVYGWFTLPIASTCSSLEITPEADAIASSNGINVSGYDRIIYILKGTAGCFWSGASNMGVTPSRAWINGNLSTKVIAHEIGHGLGLQHSNFLDCDGAVVGSDCTLAQDDKFDTMGSSKEAAHFNAFQKARLGWLDENSMATVMDSATVTLQPFEQQDGTYPSAARVYRRTDAETGDREWFYLEYRQAIGWDDFLIDNANVSGGILVHTGSDNQGGSSVLLDMTPGSQLLDRNDPALVVGESFTDLVSGVTISTEVADGSLALVNITRDTGACYAISPQVLATSAEGQAVEAGSTIIYDVTVSNQSSAACLASSFDLSAITPAGWSYALDRVAVALEPGASTTVQLSVTSSASASGGDYNVAVTATDAQDNQSSTTAAVSYLVASSSSNGAPYAVDDSASVSPGGTVTIEVLANDFDPDGDTLVVTGVGTPSKGQVVINPDHTLTYVAGKRFKKNDSFVYAVSDGVSTATAEVLITAASSGGGTGGGGGGKGKR